MRLFKKMERIALWQTRRPWLIAALLSVLAHSALLCLPGSRPVAGRQGSHSRTLQLSLHTTPEPLTMAPASPAPQAQTRPPAPSTPENNAAESAGALPRQTPESNTTFLETHYFAPEELTTKPVFLRDKGAPSPTYIPDVMPLPVLASVYIDERGEVVQVALSDNFLSEAARTFIVESFLATQFTPGMLGSLAVKSVLTVEVKLDPALPSR